MPDIFEITPGTAQYAIVITIILLIVGLLNQFMLDPGIAEQYAMFYFNLGVMGIVGGIFVTVYLGRFILSNIVSIETGAKILVTVIWIGFFTFISIQAIAGGNQVIGVPTEITTPLSVVVPNEILTRALIPAFLEDFWYLYVFSGLIATLILFFYEFVFPGEEAGFLEYSVVMVFATFLAALNFTSAHFAAYGNQIDAFIGAFIFGWGQALVYAFTGIFLPVAHFLHNYIVTVTPGFAVVSLLPLLIPLRVRRDSHDKEGRRACDADSRNNIPG